MEAIIEQGPGTTFDGAYSWNPDDGLRVVIHRIPVGNATFDGIMSGILHSDVADAPENRQWVQDCARTRLEELRELVLQSLAENPDDRQPVAIYARITGQTAHQCLVALLYLAQLHHLYPWTAEGDACLSDAVAQWHVAPADGPEPLSVCPSAGYDPRTLPADWERSGWLADRCAEIVAAHPNPAYPDDPDIMYTPDTMSLEDLPTCQANTVKGMERSGASGVERGDPRSPHGCFHSFLGYALARQLSLDERSPFDLQGGCLAYFSRGAPNITAG